MAKVRDEAWLTTVTANNAVEEALVLASSLQSCQTTRVIAVVVSCKVTPDNRARLRRVFDVLLPLDENFLKPNISAEARAKLFAITLPIFKQGVFLSSNHMILENWDSIFHSDHEETRGDEDWTHKILTWDHFMFRTNSGAQRVLEAAGMSDNLGNHLKIRRINQKSLVTLPRNYCTSTEDLVSQSPKIVMFLDYLNDKREMLEKMLATKKNENSPLVDKVIAGKWLEAYESVKSVKHSLRKSTLKNDFENEPIAIVGMSCRYPQAQNLSQFWELLKHGKDCTIPAPEDRFKREPWLDHSVNLSSIPPAGYLEGPVDEFDAQFFGLSPSEVEYMDPQFRLLHEVLWESLENAGIDPSSLWGSHTGVFTGSWLSDYKEVVDGAEGSDMFRSYLGNSIGAAAARLSRLLGVTGPSIATESGCSSAFVALYLAIQSLRRGECKVAISGGVNLLLKPYTLDMMKVLLSPSGKCSTFDKNADGYVRAEGCGVVVLKRLSDALKDKDPIWALIRGCGMAQEGQSPSMGTPSVNCEALAMIKALRDSNVDPGRVSFVESHGTGTSVGDPMEVAAIEKAYHSETRIRPLVIGSVKTNVGHTESCSGMTGLIKTVLALHHELIPRHLHLEELNPAVDLKAIPAVIPQESMPWLKDPNGEPRLAGVSSFGITGTDVHIIIQESPSYEYPKFHLGLERPQHLLTISGKTKQALQLLHNEYHQLCQEKSRKELDNGLSKQVFADVAFTANVGRKSYDFREFVIATNFREAQTKFENGSFVRGQIRGESNVDLQHICFLFPGQGSQYPGMAKQLYTTSPVFREKFDECDHRLRSTYRVSLKNILSEEASHLLQQTLYSQTSIFCVQYCLLKLWSSWGVQPSYVLGHSLGEYTAAVASGILDFSDALKLVAERSLLIEALDAGGMLAVGMDRSNMEKLLNDFGVTLDIAAINTNVQTVVAGAPDQIQLLQDYCNQHTIKAVKLKSSHAFHSREMMPILEKYRQIAESVKYKLERSDVHYISGMTGKLMESHEINADYWVRHLTEPVRFLDACDIFHELSLFHFLECGPHPVLSALVMTNGEDGPSMTCLPSLRRGQDDWSVILHSLGELYLRGYPINWRGFDNNYPRKKVSFLPVHPFQRKRYWMKSTRLKSRFLGGKCLHPLLGHALKNASATKLFQNEIQLDNLPFLRDHLIGSRILFPGTSFLEMCLVAGQLGARGGGVENDFDFKMLTQQGVILENFQIDAPLELKDGSRCTLQTVVSQPDSRLKGDNGHMVKIFHEITGQENTTEWKPHASAWFCTDKKKYGGLHSAKWDPSRLQKMVAEGDFISSENFYKALYKVGFRFGTSFQVIQRFWPVGSNYETVAQVKIPPDNDQHRLHPLVTEAVLHAAIFSGMKDAIYGKYNVTLKLPVKIGRLTVYPQSSSNAGTTPSELFVYTWEENEQFFGYLISGGPTWHPFAFFEKLVFVDTTVPTIESVLAEQGKILPDAWQEIWLPWEGSGTHYSKMAQLSGTCKSIVPSLAKESTHCLVFAPAKDEAMISVINKLGLVGKVTTIFSSKQDVDATVTYLQSPVECLSIDKHGGKIDQILSEISSPSWIIFAWGVKSFCIEDVKSLTSTFLQVAKNLLKKANPPPLFVLTRGVYSVGTNDVPVNNPCGAILHGMAKSLKNENFNLLIQCIDLEDSYPDLEDYVAQLLHQLYKSSTSADIQGQLAPFQMAFRGNSSFVPKLVNVPLARKNDALSIPTDSERSSLVLPATRLISDLTFADANNTLQEFIGDAQVEVEVKAYSLNFKDILTILKPSPVCETFHTVGLDFAGVVTKVGSSATNTATTSNFQVGDAVFGFNVTHSQLASHLTLDPRSMIKIPKTMTFWEACTLPTVFFTAYYALVKVVKLRKSDTILIHTGSGGVGLAAIQLAKHLGTKVISTAGNDVKKAYLRNLGVQHVFHSRDVSFEQNIMRVTNGRGVDVVLNSLTGPGMKEASLRVCALRARFVEMSKLSIWEASQVTKLRPDVDYHVIDLFQEDISMCNRLLRKLHDHLESGIVRPIPFIKFDAPHIRQAVKYLQQARHIGKVVISMSNSRLTPGIHERCLNISLFSDNSAYLITGGLHGIGFQVGKWMLTKGATNIVLVGRSPPNIHISTEIDRLRKASNNRIEVLLGDVRDFNQCRQLLKKIEERCRAPLRGIMHCAGVLRDGPYETQSWESFNDTFAAKVRGTWNLHEISKLCNLEHFVLFSSVSALLGTYAQPNYVAANAFMDAFSHYRHSLGLPATSINWGVWFQVGMTETTHVNGVAGVSVSRMLHGLERVLRTPTIVQTCLCDFSSFSELSILSPLAKSYIDGQVWLNTYASEGNIPQTGPCMTPGKFWKTYNAVNEKSQQIQIVSELLQSSIKEALRLDPDKTLSITEDIAHAGVDSLLALELKSKIETFVGSRAKLNASIFRENRTIKDISTAVWGRLNEENSDSKSTADNKNKYQQVFKNLLEADCLLPEDIRVSALCLGSIAPSKISCVLVTGGTGFLGRHVVDLLSSTAYASIKKVVCIARSLKNLSPELINPESASTCQVEWLEGDIILENLGIHSSVYQKLCETVEAVIHCAANTNHVEMYTSVPVADRKHPDVRTVNVLGTLNILKFATSRRIKQVYFASTFLSPGTLGAPSDDSISDDWPDKAIIDWVVTTNIPAYNVSKFVCEVLLQQANIRGIPCQVFRLPSISGHSTTGQIDYHKNHLIHRLAAFLQLKAMPRVSLPLNVLPVDICAEASLKLFFNDEAAREIFFLTHPTPQPEQDFVADQELVGGIELVEFEEFAKIIQQQATPLDAFVELYTETERMVQIINIFARKGYTGSRNEMKHSINEKVLRLMPDFCAKIETPMTYVCRDLQYAQAQNFSWSGSM